MALELDERLTVEVMSASENPIAGWVSRGYHRKGRATTLIGRCATGGDVSLLCRIEVGEPNGEAGAYRELRA